MRRILEVGLILSFLASMLAPVAASEAPSSIVPQQVVVAVEVAGQK